uniref:scavenger receptor class B member 1-like isoform X2 n=1 Tax=Myxine glutinosa TaxID=7769 RepID=UPI00358F6999
MRILPLAIAGVGLALMGLVVQTCLMPLLHHKVAQGVVLKPKGETFEMWRAPSLPLYQRIYLFNLTNPTEAENGKQPNLTEIGPYVYRVYRTKENITFHDNATVSYRERKRLEFVSELSAGSEEDIISTINVPAMSMAMTMKRASFFTRLAASATLGLSYPETILSLSVSSLLWGYTDSLISTLTSLGQFPLGRFGLLAEHNDSLSGLYSIFTGEDDPSKAHSIDMWNGKRQVTYWKSLIANQMLGTVGQLWPPFLPAHRPLAFFNPDACRSLWMDFVGENVTDGITVYKYRFAPSLFTSPPPDSFYPPSQHDPLPTEASPSPSPSADEAYCPCLKSGTISLSKCRKGVPIYLSQPHFLDGDPSLQLSGLAPDRAQHGTEVLIHPLTGVPLSVNMKFQVNLLIESMSDFPVTKKFSKVLLPLIWFSEGGDVTGGFRDRIYTNLVLMPHVVSLAAWVALGLGVVLCLIAAALAARKQWEGFRSGDTNEAETTRRG